LKLVGHDLLYLSFCSIMAGVNLVGTVFAADATAAGVMAKMALHYVGEAIKTAGKVIMPILNTIIDVLFGTSSAGKVIKNIFTVLCEIFNFTVDKILIPIWCGLIRPIFGGILKVIEKIIRPFDGNAADNMANIVSTVLGGNSDDVQACLGALNVHIPCSMSEDEVNGSFFPNQPIATRCWVDSSSSYYTAGASVLAGTSTNSFLACTMSDTCALDPLRFDDYSDASDLVPCASCPSVLLADEGQKFGCNSYLKRCTCGIRSQQAAACTQNSDCSQQPRSICSVTSNIDFARDAVTSMPCTHCHGLGAEPTCVMDGAASTGVCSCTAVRQNLHTCSAVGQSVFLLSERGECLAMTSAYQADATRLSFSELSIAPCALGVASKCVLVSLPLSSGGAQATPFAVLTGLLYGGAATRTLVAAVTPTRRLLSVGGATANASAVHRRWCEDRWRAREDVRWCTHWKLVGNRTLAAWAGGDPNATALLLDNNIQDTFLLSATDLLQAVTRNPAFFARLLQDSPHLIRMVLSQHSGLWPVFVNTLWQSAEDAWFSSPAAGTKSNNTNNNNSAATTTTASGRRLLGLWDQQTTVTDSYYTDNVVVERYPTCVALEIPLHKIVAAFWDTVRYYENINDYVNQEACNAGDNCSSHSYYYRLPPATQQGGQPAGILSIAADLFLMIPTGGVGGRRTMDALFSTISYDEALVNNYITGRRVLKEISFCNYTTLTFGPPVVQKLLPLLLTLFFFFFLFTFLFSPNSFLTWGLWLFVFPSILYWAAYNLSPLCWPMMPPRLPHDVTMEIKALIPTSIEIPAFLIEPNCTVRGLLSDGTYDPACFKSCSQHPFFFVSWQDVLAWWMCEIHSGTCRDVGVQASRWSALQDMTASLQYFADVVDFAGQDSDFMRAHRVCAVFTLYHLIFAVLAAAFVVLLAPATIMAITQIFGASLELVMEANGAENIID
jgi:hypothetical protein